MLDKHLIAHTCPYANEKNVLFWGAYRVTVLQDRLFRIERSEQRKFRDEATQSVWFRNMPPQEFTSLVSEEGLTVETKACKLIIKKNRADCRVQVNGKSLCIDNDGNLKGTYRTLDVCDGKVWRGKIWDGSEDREIKLENGVCSKTGVTVFDDAASLTVGEDGEIKAVCGDGTDEYLFVYGDDYRSAVNALYLITGKTPLLPRFVFGNWWSRYYVYTDKEYLRVLDYFADSNADFICLQETKMKPDQAEVPLDVEALVQEALDGREMVKLDPRKML